MKIVPVEGGNAIGLHRRRLANWSKQISKFFEREIQTDALIVLLNDLMISLKIRQGRNKDKINFLVGWMEKELVVDGGSCICRANRAPSITYLISLKF